MIFHFSWMSIKIRYTGTHLGLLWTAVEPLLYFVLLYVVFTSIRDSREDFAIYLITGIMFFHLFVRGTYSGLTSLRENKMIIQSLNVKKEIFPLITTFSTLILMFVVLAVFFGLMPIFDFVPHITIILLPVLMILFILLVLGVSYYLAIFNVFFRDIQPIWSVFSYALLFISPIFWYVDNTEGILLVIQKINPLGQIIELGHKIVFGELPSWNEWAYSSLIIFVILISGYFIFRKYEKIVAEKI